MSAIKRLQTALIAADFWAEKANVKSHERYADTLANVRGALKPGGKLSDGQAIVFAETLEHAASIWMHRWNKAQEKTANEPKDLAKWIA